MRTTQSPLASISMDAGTIHLMAAGDGVEVIQHRLQRGARFGMVPADGYTGFEAVTVASGSMTCISGGLGHIGPGDTLSAWPVRRPYIFEADEDTVLVHVASKPIFDTGGEEVRALQALASEVAERDGYTGEHCRRVQALSVELARAMNLPPERIRWLVHGAFLHDLGKSRVPQEIVKKPGPLTVEERAVMRQHPTWGREIVAETHLAPCGAIIEQHHERLDGSGYPLGLKGDEILLEAQVVAVADTFDAITSHRPYHRAEGANRAVAELERCAGTLFRRDVVDALAALTAVKDAAASDADDLR